MRPNRSIAPCLLALLAAACFLFAAPTQAQTSIWTGAADSDWGTALNWNPNTAYPNSVTTTAVFEPGTGTSSVEIGLSGALSPTVAGMIFNSAYTLKIDATSGLTLVGTGITGTSSVSITNLGNLSFTNGASAGAATINTAAGGTVNFSGLATGNNATLLLSGTLNAGAMAQGLTLGSLSNTGAPGTVVLGSTALSEGSLDDNDSFRGIITGSGSLTKVGTGTLTLSGVNTYTGATNINAGTLALGVNNALSTGGVLADNATLNLNGFNQQFSALSGNGAVTNSSGTFSTLTVNGATSDTFAGTLSGTLNLTDSGTGMLTLTGNNSYLGVTSLDSGVLVAGSTNALGFGNILLAGGTLVVDQASLRNNTISLDTPSVVLLEGNSTLSGNINLASDTLQIGNGGIQGTSTLSGNLSGSGALVINPSLTPSTLVLSGNNSSYGGNITLEGGTLNLDSINALGTGILTMDTGTVLQDSALSTLALPNLIMISSSVTIDTQGNTMELSALLNAGASSGSFTKIGSGTLVLLTACDYSGGTSLADGTLSLGSNNSLGTGALTMANGTTLQDYLGNLAVTNSIALNGSDTVDTQTDSFTLSGAIGDGVSPGSLTKIGTGTLALSGANSYSGGTTLDAGTLALGNNSALGTGALVLASGTTLQAAAAGLAVSNNVSLNGSDTVDTQANSFTLSGTLSDGGSPGSLTKIGSGTLDLSGDNAYSGGTSLAVGTLGLGNNNALGTGGLSMASGTTLQAAAANLAVTNNIGLNGADTYDSNGNNSTFSGVLVGAGSLAVTNSNGTAPGSLTLTGANNYSGGTSVQGGTLVVDTGGSLGTGAVVNSATLEYADNATAGATTITNVNSTGAALNFLGSSSAGSANVTDGYTDTVYFENSSTAGTASFYNEGSLDFLTSSNASNADIVNVNGLYFNETASAGSATILNESEVYFENNSTAGAASITNDGLMQVTDHAMMGSATIVNGGAGVSTATLQFYSDSNAQNAVILNGRGDRVFFDNASSAGSAVITNDGTLGFQGDGAATIATAGSALVTNNSTLFFSSFSSAGGATIATNAGATLVFSESGDGGTARFIVNSGGSFDISSDTNAAVTAGSIEGAGNFYLGAGDLADGSNNLSTAVSGVIDDGGSGGGTGGSLTKIGTGTLMLSGADAYTGGTQVDSGMLLAANASALGTGSVAVNGGTLALSGPMTLDIGGHYTQGVSGTLQLGLGATVNQWDNLDIAGAATLAGTLKLVSYGGFQLHDNESFTIIDAASVTGTFSTVTDTVGGAGVGVSLVYNPTDVVLDVVANAGSFESLGTTWNQKNVGAALDSLAGKGLDPSLINYLDTLSDSALPGVYNQLSPANLTPLYQMDFAVAQAEAGLVGSRISQLFGNLDLNPDDTSWNGQGPMFAGDMPAAQEAAISKDSQPQRWGVFVNGLGNFGTVTGDGNGPGYQYSTGGTAAGLDYRFSKDFVGGLLLGYSSSGTSASTGTVNSTGGQAGLYAGWKQQSLHIEALAAGGINSYTTQRQALGGTAAGRAQGQQFSGELTAGYDLKMDQVKLQPYVAGQYTNVGVNAFTESGSMAPLSFGAQSEGYLSSDLGATASRKWDLGGGAALSPMVSASWEHVYQGNLDSLAANFGSGPNFTVNGPATGKDAAVLGAGVNALLGKGLDAFVQYQGKLRLANYAEQNVSGGINLGF